MKFNEKSALDKIISFYLGEYTIVALYLTGSRANNTARADSDFDLHIVYKGEIPRSLTLDSNIITDVKVIEYTELKDSIIETPYAPAVPFKRLFLDEEHVQIIEELEIRTLKSYDAGPDKWGKDVLNEKQQQIFRFLEAIKSTVDNEIVSFRHMCKFFDLALNYWFSIRGEWSKSTHNALSVFKERDVDFYDSILSFVQSKDIKEKVKICEKIYRILFNI